MNRHHRRRHRQHAKFGAASSAAPLRSCRARLARARTRRLRLAPSPSLATAKQGFLGRQTLAIDGSSDASVAQHSREIGSRALHRTRDRRGPHRIRVVFALVHAVFVCRKYACTFLPTRRCVLASDSSIDVPLLKRLQRLIREASLQTSALHAGVRVAYRRCRSLTHRLQIRSRLSTFSSQIGKFDNATRFVPCAYLSCQSYVIVAYPYSALSAAISSFMARHDNASLPSAKGLAELGVNVRTLLPAGKPPDDAVHQIASSAPHVALAAAEFFKDPSNRTKASDFARAITHMKLVLAAVLRYTLLHPLPEPEPLPGKFTGIDSIYYISKSIVETLIRSSSLPAGELIRERDECTDAVRLAMQLVSMLREYATEITAGTRRLQRILAAAAGVRVNAGALRSQVKTLLPRTSRDSGSPILSNDRKKLEAVKRQLLTSVVEVNEVRCHKFVFMQLTRDPTEPLGVYAKAKGDAQGSQHARREHLDRGARGGRQSVVLSRQDTVRGPSS